MCEKFKFGTILTDLDNEWPDQPSLFVNNCLKIYDLTICWPNSSWCYKWTQRTYFNKCAMLHSWYNHYVCALIRNNTSLKSCFMNWFICHISAISSLFEWSIYIHQILIVFLSITRLIKNLTLKIKNLLLVIYN